MAIIDRLNPTERAALMATREMRSGQKPELPSPKKIAKFTEMREEFLNWSPKRLCFPVVETSNPKRGWRPSALTYPTLPIPPTLAGNKGDILILGRVQAETVETPSVKLDKEPIRELRNPSQGLSRTASPMPPSHPSTPPKSPSPAPSDPPTLRAPRTPSPTL